MTINTRLAGLGALAFGLLPLVAGIVANPPGGDYSASAVADFIAKGHRTAVFASIYIIMLSAVGLLLLLARLRDSIDGRRASLFWALGLGAVVAWLCGAAIVLSPSIALAFSGGKLTSLPAPDAFALSEAGWAVMYGAGGTLLGCALVAYVVGNVTVPRWVRFVTGVAALCSFAAIAWFPFILVYVWAIALGIWMLAGDRGRVPAAVPA
jgi:hypothetical protein